MLVHIAARVVERHPLLNATFAGDAIMAFDEVNVAVAVAGPDGLRVPVLRNAARRSIQDLSAALVDLVERARASRLTPAESEHATFSISNLGPGAVTAFVPIVNPPQSAILAVGSLVPKVLPTPDGSAVVRRAVTLTLAADHRVVDGADAAAFLTDLVAAFEQPQLLEEGSPS